jgi:protein-L-isoaspartate O-methyltransferase
MKQSGISASATYRPAQDTRLSAYTKHAGSYEQRTGAFQSYRRTVVEALPVRPGQVVLDVGSGTGLCSGLLQEKVGPQGGVVGIEESPEMAAVARERIESEGWRNVTVVEAPFTTSCSPRARCVMSSPGSGRGHGWLRAAASGPHRGWWG